MGKSTISMAMFNSLPDGIANVTWPRPIWQIIAVIFPPIPVTRLEARQETKPTAEDIAKKDADVSQLGGLSIRRIRLAKK